ncbi:hypothetical protein GCM10008018_49800 [Paenibacillus marchantiophytorum]|uniref:ComF family protein n=1 Tax=Paenibacillus marchantiophytorum TaxID=1619310 RepID=A0ABQ1F2P3_9BACL|nr:hypothetical protein GCM10008018_49800 [Paenibacillus marchantiophytorum]
MLARYKYRGDERIKSVIGCMLVHAYHLLYMEELSEKSNPKRGIITFVPVSKLRMQERGFNQAEQMARELGLRLRLPVQALLQRAKHTDKQSFKSRNERLDDLEHVFEVDLSVAYQIDLKSIDVIILLDDVYTTGSTMNQCAKVLRENFSAEVYGLTWAR